MSRIIKNYHGKYLVNEYEIGITQGMRDDALDFAKRIIKTNNQFSRLLPKGLKERGIANEREKERLEIQRTYVGKLGELAFLSLLLERGIEYNYSDIFTIYEGQENTDSFDFITSNGSSVDVKTGFRSNHSRLLVNIQQFNNLPKDYYVGVRLCGQDIPGSDKLVFQDSIQKAIIKGYADKNYLDKRPTRDFGEGPAKYLSYDRLLGIDRLLELF